MLELAHHVHYIVRSRDDFLTFMDRTFDLKPNAIEDRAEGLGAGNRDATFKVGHTLLEVTQPTTGLDTLHGRWLAKHGPGIYHVAWGVSGLVEAGRAIEQAGVRLDGAPVDIQGDEGGINLSHWGYNHANINPEDSAGVHFQLAEGAPEWERKHPGREDDGSSLLKFVHHVHYIVHSRDDFLAFMRRTFGLNPNALEERPSGFGALNRDATFMIGNTLLEVTEPTTGLESLHGRWLARHGPGIWHVAWGVDDLTGSGKDQVLASGTRLQGAPFGISEAMEDGDSVPVSTSHWGYEHANVNVDDSAGVRFQLADGLPKWARSDEQVDNL